MLHEKCTSVCSDYFSKFPQELGVCCEEKDVVGDLLRELEAVKNEPAPEQFPFDASLNQNCGKRFAGTRIVNGLEAVQHEFPFMAGLLNGDRQFCGGSLIDENHILTAAHCVSQ